MLHRQWRNRDLRYPFLVSDEPPQTIVVVDVKLSARDQHAHRRKRGCLPQQLRDGVEGPRHSAGCLTDRVELIDHQQTLAIACDRSKCRHRRSWQAQTLNSELVCRRERLNTI